jgi:hypothetical protein
MSRRFDLDPSIRRHLGLTATSRALRRGRNEHPLPKLPPVNSLWALRAGSWIEPSYPDGVAARPMVTAEEWFERMREAAPPTDDDVTTLWDGRRLDSREKVLEWLEEVEAKRAEGVTHGADDLA